MQLKDEGLEGLRVLQSPLERDIYSRDQAEVPDELRRFFMRGNPSRVVQPRSEGEIERVLRYAHEHDLPVVPRGAASSPYGGAIPTRGGIVLDLSLMRTIMALDRSAGVVALEAGVRWADLDDLLKANGYALRSHPSSWFSTVAGWLNTGGYGIQSLGFGPFWSQVDWIRVVGFNGSRTILRGSPEFQFYVHSEGQMGVVSQLGLRVRPRPSKQLPLLFTFPGPGEALSAGQVIARRFRPVHLVYYDPARLREFNRVQAREVLEEAHSLLVVTEDEAVVEPIVAYVQSGVRAEHHRASYLWEHRLFPMLVKQLGPGILGAELLMKAHAVPRYLEKAERLASRYGVHLSHEFQFVRPGEGLAITAFLTDQREFSRYLPHLVLVLVLTAAGVMLGGQAYGIGLWNRPFLRTRYTWRQLAALKRYKRKVDPKGLLNPGKGISGLPLPVDPRLLTPALLSPALVGMASRLLRPRHPPAQVTMVEERDIRSAAECAHCSACITVCPAYLADRTELVTARGKLMALERLAAGEELAREDALKLFDCIHCSACTNVCQSGIDLVPIWDRLEAQVAERYGKPIAQIEDFARRVEEEPEYHQLVQKGLAYPLQTPRGSYKRV